ncbi:alkylation response protein AidB-like acyl-CoA dehydrogenase [Brevibacterium sanguinis]|uniref:Alkylation response protein AidB-like acyl-CoA dehydrogenase n=2 Tax=Brevibacterium TaxID=1696 RepID=A0A366INQ4_9MICO|nr:MULTISPECIES: acyl-CoA dehydrogenase family protein [Brevibacterium]RBP66984.1 alkylation response protein AidB-like acyl-CoA dehydrogenase [Brevibacterium sanguinis]RBP73509.1 alkylation response protein AidB-like acyl-CoA dehydrogenase [Brevibacterium celere]
MDLELSDIQQELAGSLAKYLRSEYDQSTREAILHSAEGISRDQWASFAQMGLLGLAVPEAYGGAGMTFAEVGVVMEAFGRALVLEPYLATVVLGANALTLAGSEEQKQAVLPSVCEGTAFLAFAVLEPGSRYSVGSPATIAQGTGDLGPGSDSTVRPASQSGGDTVTLRGEKSGVLGGDVADHLIVTAMEDGELGLFLVDASAQGVHRIAHRQADGLGSASVRFDDAPAQRLDAAPAAEVVARVLDTANAAIMAEAVGAMEVSLRMTADYLKTREQFGAPIGANQALQHRAADMYATLEEARSMALYARLAVSSGVEGAEKDRHRDVIAAKIIVDRCARHISQESIQMHGGIGMTMEYPIGHYAKRLTVIARTFDDADSLTAELAQLGGLIEPYAADLN